ncbi:MAG: hypothetical protein OEU32_03605 [Acidimicrobiia bacterium]|nr:hypothetical protein [Acidimicrobiia bacterium]
MPVIGPTEQTPEVEAVVWRNGHIIHRQFCDSAEEVADLADAWSDQADVIVTVRDVGVDEPSEEDPPQHEIADMERGTEVSTEP